MEGWLKEIRYMMSTKTVDNHNNIRNFFSIAFSSNIPRFLQMLLKP